MKKRDRITTNIKTKKFVFILLCTGTLLSLVLFLPLQNHRAFESPDENANYLATKLYSSTGQLWYHEDYTTLDVENYLHPRHFVTYSDRVVPTEFLGTPITYGPLYALAGDASAKIWIAIFSLLSFFYFIKLASLLLGENASLYAAIIFLASLPLLYYLNMPYYNSTGAISFFICGLFYLTSFSRLAETRDLIISTLFFSLSILFRLDYSIFIALLFLITLANKYRTNLKAYLKPLVLWITMIVVLCLIPTFILNLEVYGKATTFGTQLLQTSSIGKEGLTWWQFALPYPVIPDIILANTYRLIIRLLPLLALLSFTGILYYLRGRKFDAYKLLYVVLFIYVIIYSGSSDTWLAYDFSYLGLGTSIIRYWLIDYVFISIMAVAGIYFLHRKYPRLVPLLAAVLLVTSINNFFIDNERSILELSKSLDYRQKIIDTIQAEVDTMSIVYSDTFDKVLVPNGMHAAGWWAGEKTYAPSLLAKSMARLSRESNYTIYLYAPSSYIDVSELNDILEEDNLFLNTNVAVKYLYELGEKQP